MEQQKTTDSSRRSFIRHISMATAVLLSGNVQFLSARQTAGLQKKTILRFAVASDIHYGQPDTLFDEMLTTMTQQVNKFHTEHPLDFCVLNGDLIHDKKSFMVQVKQKTDALKMPYHVTRGNHDMVTGEEWEQVWKTPLNYDLVVGETAIILADTSNEKGIYLSPDLVWLEQKLETHKQKRQVLLFLHIPQAKWTRNGIDTPAFFELIRRYPNVRAVFHGHEHDQDGVKMDGRLPFFLDSHVGGNWGTAYKGFRVVELLDNGTLLTYMMNPSVKMDELRYEAG